MRPELEPYLEDLVTDLGDVFGDGLTGVWAVGSAAYGGFDEHSDLDVQAATEAPPTAEQIARVVDMITATLASCPAEGLEFVLYDRAVLIHPEPPLQWALNLNGGPAREYRVSTDPESESWHWFVLDLAMGRDLAVTLHGKPMSAVVGKISREVQLAAIRESQAWHRAREPFGPNHLGNAARALRYVETGVWGSKPDGRSWLAESGRTEREAVDLLEAVLV